MKDKKKSSQIKSESDEQYNKNISKQMKKAGDIYSSQNNYEQALQFYERAAELGNREVQSIIDNLRYKEKEENPDLQKNYNISNSCDVKDKKELSTETLDTFIKTAGEENPLSQLYLGIKYYNGDGVDKDYKKAFDYFSNITVQRSKYAQFFLGLMYETGKGVDQNYEKAEEWYKKAAAQDLDTASYNLGYLFKCKALGGGFITKDSYKYELEALKWFTKAAEQGNIEAQYELGHLYDTGDFGFILEPDYKKAFGYYEMAAEQCHVEAQYNLGILYYAGQGIERDFNAAKSLWENAASQKHSGAQFGLGFLYEKGYGVKQDYQLAKAWYLKSSENCNYYANFRLGVLYFNGFGVEKDFSIAKSWWEKEWNIACIYCLSCMYKYGIGTPKDLEKSKQLFDEINDYISDEDIIYIHKKTIAEIDDMFSKVL